MKVDRVAGASAISSAHRAIAQPADAPPPASKRPADGRKYIIATIRK